MMKHTIARGRAAQTNGSASPHLHKFGLPRQTAELNILEPKPTEAFSLAFTTAADMGGDGSDEAKGGRIALHVRAGTAAITWCAMHVSAAVPPDLDDAYVKQRFVDIPCTEAAMRRRDTGHLRGVAHRLGQGPSHLRDELQARGPPHPAPEGNCSRP